MGFLGSFLQAAVDTVSLPLDVIQDLAEGGENERTARKVGKVGGNLSESVDDLLEGELL